MESDRPWWPSRTVLTANAATIRRFLDEVHPEAGDPRVVKDLRAGIGRLKGILRTAQTMACSAIKRHARDGSVIGKAAASVSISTIPRGV